MIVCLEGVDCCGKSTLYEALQKRGNPWKFVPRLPNSPALMAVMPEVELRQAALWAALHDPATLYLTDRHVCVSAPVYDSLYNRDCYVDGMLHEHLRVVYLHVPIAELKRRYDARGDELFDKANIERAVIAYEHVLPRFQHIRLDGTLTTFTLAEQVERYVQALFTHEIRHASVSTLAVG